MSATQVAAGGGTDIRELRIGFPEEDLADLRRRIEATRWPERETVDDESQGVPLAMMQTSRATGRRTTTGAGARPG
jgi:hypothetical protein